MTFRLYDTDNLVAGWAILTLAALLFGGILQEVRHEVRTRGSWAQWWKGD
jgi:hypothetical protein